MTVPSGSSEVRGGGRQGARIFGLVVGAMLILFGVLSLLGELLHIDVGALMWPFFIIVPGAALFLVSLVSGRGGEPLAYIGSIWTMVGLILLFQNTTGLWHTWAYAWALVPTSIGLGQIVYGALKGRGELVKRGLRLAGIGMVAFLVAAAFFELVLGISGFGFGPLALPFLLIGLGVLLFGVNLLRALSSK